MNIFLITNHSFMLYKFRKELIQQLLTAHHVTLVMPAREYTEAFRQMGCDIMDVDVDRRGINPLTDYRLLRTYRTILKQHHPDMVLTYSIKPNIYAGMAAAKLHIPYCANITGLGTAFQRKVLANFVTVLYRYAFRKVKTVFFENQSNLNEFLNRSILKKEKTCLLSGAGVNLQEFQCDEYPEGQTTNFIFVGRIMKEKGIDELLEAFRRLENDHEQVHLDIVGPFEDDYEEEMKRLEHDPNCRYCGFQNDVRPFLAKAHCLVLPSYHEGMANTILEAAACSRAVIASDIPGCREGIADQNSGYLVKKKDANDLYEKMKQFVQRLHEEKRQMGREGRKLMEQKFDKQRVVDQTVSAIERQE